MTLILLTLMLACGDKDGGDSGLTADGGTADGGTADGGTADGGTADGGTADGGVTDDFDNDGWPEDDGSGDGDCDDQDPTVYPGADEIPWDEIDQDCDGSDAGTLASATGEGDIAIPDPGNIEAHAEISGCDTVYGTTVNVDISHTYIGDLIVSLQAPDGTANALHIRTGEDTADIVGSYSSEWGASLEAAIDLSALNGLVGTGSWTLVIHDMTAEDAGTLNSWDLELRCP